MHEKQQNRVYHKTHYIKSTSNPIIAPLDFGFQSPITKSKEIISSMKKVVSNMKLEIRSISHFEFPLQIVNLKSKSY